MINFGSANSFLKQIEFKIAGRSEHDKWIDCDKKKIDVMDKEGHIEKKSCRSVLTKYLNDEFHLTAFMLRILSKSIIDITGNNPLVFKITDVPKLNGLWNLDKKYINIIEVEKGKKKRLIMGLTGFWKNILTKIL